MPSFFPPSINQSINQSNNTTTPSPKTRVPPRTSDSNRDRCTINARCARSNSWAPKKDMKQSPTNWSICGSPRKASAAMARMYMSQPARM